MGKRKAWFEVSRSGLAQLAKRRGVSFIVTEPIQNAWDESTSEVAITLEAVPGIPRVDIVVTDDSPDGFRDLADSYMMFAPSYKLANPEQRGRFNVGEKLLLAVADNARITSTTGSVIFGPNGRSTGRKKTDVGSILEARLKMTRAELDDALRITKMLIPPPGIRTTINGELLADREPLASGRGYLETEIRGEEGGFKYSWRMTDIKVYEPLEGEEPHVYEMGIPIDKVEGPWHIEVCQKVPLSIDRASVRLGFLQDLLKESAEIMSDQMSEDISREGWVGTALESMSDDQSVRDIIRTRFGKAVTFDPSSPESNKLAIDAGYKLVHGGELTKLAWGRVRATAALQPAGKRFPDGKVHLTEGGVPAVSRSDWTVDMEKLAAYAREFADHVIGHPMDIEFYDDAGLNFAAFCGRGTIALNVGTYSVKKAIEEHDAETLDQLLIHECAHDKVSDHLTHEYHRECCRIGAKLRTFAYTAWWRI